LHLDLPYLDDIERAQRPQRLPAVFTRLEVKAILTQLTGAHHLMASLLYGSGLRITECFSLRVKDIDFEYRQVTICDGKGMKDCVTLLPLSLVETLQNQLAQAKLLFYQDLAEGFGAVCLSCALELMP
jgi:integrase